MSNEERVKQIRETESEADRKELLSCLYQRNYPLIRQICCRYAHGDDPEDLTQEAYFGLHTAVEKYDAGMDVPFVNFAVLWIKQSIRRYMNNTGSMVRLPEYMRQDIRKYKKAVNEFRMVHGCDPSDAELTKILQITSSQLEQMRRNILFDTVAFLSASLPGTDDDSFSLEDTVTDPESEAAFMASVDELDKKRKTAEIWQVVDSLGEIPAAVLHRRYENEETLESIGNAFGKTQEGIRQIQNRSLQKLRLSPVILRYQDEYTKAFRGGLQSFRHSQTSITERVALDRYERQVERYRKQVERDMRTIKRKYGVDLGDNYLEEKVNAFKSSMPTG